VPTLLAFIVGFAMFKRRVGGVYFAIITQAVCLILTVLIIGQQGYTGGVNGITDLKTMLGWDIRTESAKYILYFVNAVLLIVAPSCCAAGSSSASSDAAAGHARQGRPRPLLRLRRVDVQGVRLLSGRDAVRRSAARCSRCRSASCRRRFVGIVPSIEMVIFAAVGGRMSLVGAVYGTLLVNFGKT
jgi:urea transport system permease protein